MPDAALVLLSLGLGLALAAAALMTLRRTGSVAAASRELSASRRAIREYAASVDLAIGPILGRIDAVRRRLVEPSEISAELATARERVEGLAEEGRAIAVPKPMRAVHAILVEEVERAGRALDMVEHGCRILAEARPRGRELEAQTSIKRGYLNLLHAREAIARHAGSGAGRAVGSDRQRDLGRVAE